MPAFRRTTEDPAATSAEPPVDETDDRGAKPAGKGRPTPKRREAQKARRQALKAPTNRKEAARLRRDKVKEQRRLQRHALTTGDERNLPPRDAGPVRRYVRDYVDTRRSIGSFFLPAAILLLFASTVQVIAPVVSLGYAALLLGIIVDSLWLARTVQRTVAERFGADQAHGIRWYAVTRALQIRRLRMPPPKVKRGDPIR